LEFHGSLHSHDVSDACTLIADSDALYFQRRSRYGALAVVVDFSQSFPVFAKAAIGHELARATAAGVS
jgi:hypothetical protein